MNFRSADRQSSSCSGHGDLPSDGSAAASLAPEMVITLFDQLRKNLGDSNAGIRAKALRSMGKLARYGHLQDQEKGLLKTICDRVLGQDEHHEWDRAYVVRREAEETASYLQ